MIIDINSKPLMNVGDVVVTYKSFEEKTKNYYMIFSDGSDNINDPKYRLINLENNASPRGLVSETVEGLIKKLPSSVIEIIPSNQIKITRI